MRIVQDLIELVRTKSGCDELANVFDEFYQRRLAAVFSSFGYQGNVGVFHREIDFMAGHGTSLDMMDDDERDLSTALEELLEHLVILTFCTQPAGMTCEPETRSISFYIQPDGGKERVLYTLYDTDTGSLDPIRDPHFHLARLTLFDYWMSFVYWWEGIFDALTELERKERLPWRYNNVSLSGLAGEHKVRFNEFELIDLDWTALKFIGKTRRRLSVVT